MKTLDLIVYGGIALVAAVTWLWPKLKEYIPSRPNSDADWRQPWVASLMDLQLDLESASNSVAAETCRQLIMEIVSNGPASKPQKVK